MFTCSKLRQSSLEMEVSTFERIQRVIWDHLLPFKGEIIQKQALFSIPSSSSRSEKNIIDDRQVFNFLPVKV